VTDTGHADEAEAAAEDALADRGLEGRVILAEPAGAGLDTNSTIDILPALKGHDETQRVSLHPKTQSVFEDEDSHVGILWFTT